MVYKFGGWGSLGATCKSSHDLLEEIQTGEEMGPINYLFMLLLFKLMKAMKL